MYPFFGTLCRLVINWHPRYWELQFSFSFLKTCINFFFVTLYIIINNSISQRRSRFSTLANTKPDLFHHQEVISQMLLIVLEFLLSHVSHTCCGFFVFPIRHIEATTNDHKKKETQRSQPCLRPSSNSLNLNAEKCSPHCAEPHKYTHTHTQKAQSQLSKPNQLFSFSWTSCIH